MISKEFFYQTFSSWLIILLPVFLITGPFLSDAAISIICIIFLINTYYNRKQLLKFYNNIYFKLFIFFWIILIVSSLLSDHILISLKTSFFYFRFGIFSLCFWYLIEKNEIILKYIFFSILYCFSVLIIDGYIQYIFGQNILGIKLYNNFRVSSFFGSELILGSYLSRLFPILFGLFIYLDLKSKNRNKKLLTFVTLIFVFTEGLIFLSGERLALFFMNLSAVFIIVMIKKYKSYRFWTYIISISLIILLLFLFPKSKERMIDQTINDLTKRTETINIFSKPHNDMYVTAYKIFNDNKLFGVGPRQYRNICEEYRVSEYSCSTHPHNTYMELLAEAGLIGFLFVFSLFLVIIYCSLRQLLNKLFNKNINYFNDFELCLISAILISIWPISPSGSFFNNWLSIVYFFPVGIMMWQRNNKFIKKVK